MIPTLILSDIIRHKKCPKRYILKVLVKNSVITRDGKFIYRYKECLDFASKSNNLTDRFPFFLHFEAVLLNFLSSFIYIS